MNNTKIALVTGGNKGIGFEVVRQMARLGFRVFLAARNVNAGRAAAEKLNGDGTVTFLELD
ncbi:MAG: SDR family NAD(P)-dependent oxidoreductase, partial [Chthoniobacterales bacterium]|nr:SDR family NAD(P)-dependent oxidoreductase [Chthoniobacterales bacterium]